MRVLLVAARYLPHRGGLETVVHEVATWLTSQGHQVMIVTNRFPRTLAAREEIDGIPIRRLLFIYPEPRYLRSKKIGLWLVSFPIFPATLFQLMTIIRRFKPDVVNLHYVGNSAPFVLLLRRMFHFPLVVSLHGSDVFAEPKQSRLHRGIFGLMLINADETTACSQILLDEALDMVPEIAEKARVIHNGVNAALFLNAPEYQSERPYLFAAGRLSHTKGFDILIAAFERIANQRADLDLLIAGEGTERALLETQIQHASLTHRITLMGVARPEQVASLMRGAHAVLIPSRHEAFGIVALEAMAAGRPIIAHRVGGLVEALQGAEVTWVHDEKPANWASAILATGDMPQANAHNRAEAAQHSWTATAQKYLSVILNVSSQRSDQP